MLLFKNKYLPYLLLFLFSVPLFFLNIWDVHSWGDDFAQYIKEAQNIANGKPFYLSGYIYNHYNNEYAPPQYPPGFPLLLVPVVKIWGIAIRPMLYMNSVIAGALLFGLFEYFRKHTSVITAFFISLAITYSSTIIDLKGNILSDISCLLFVVFYLTARNEKSFPWWRILLLILLAEMAILIRSQAILLPAAEAIYLLISAAKNLLKNKRFLIAEVYGLPSVYIIIGVLVINFVLNKTLFYSPISTGTFYNQFVHEVIHGNLIEMAKSHFNRLLPDIGSFFYYGEVNNFYRTIMLIVKKAAIVFSIIGFIICISRRVTVDDIFFLLMCLLIIFLPVHDQRYFLPAIPLLFFYCYVTLKLFLSFIAKKNAVFVGALLTVVYMSIGYGYFKKAATVVPDGCMPQPKDLAAFQYISQHVNEWDIIAFSKPRALTLYTNKRSINIAWTSFEINKKIFDSFQVKYMLILPGLDDNVFKEYLMKKEHPIDSVNISDGYMLYTLR